MDETGCEILNAISQLAATADTIKTPQIKKDLVKLISALVEFCLPPEEQHIRVFTVHHNAEQQD